MKSYLILFTACLMLCSGAVARTLSHPLVEDGKVWNYKASNPEAENYTEWEEIYSLEGDTVIDSHRCLKLYVTTNNSPYIHYDHLYIGAMYEEGEDVYYIASGNTTSAILYDFSGNPGDIVTMDLYELQTTKYDEYGLIINEKQLVKYRNEYLTVIKWSLIDPDKEEAVDDFSSIWIEGIGSPIDLLNSTPIWNTGCYEQELVTCKLNDQIIYDKDEFEASAQYVTEEDIPQEYFPEGTNWTEIRLDTLKYDSWYSKVDGEWVPNFETIEYRVQGEFIDDSWGITKYTCVYTNGPEWSDSLTLMINEMETEYDSNIRVTTPFIFENFYVPACAYQMKWYVGKKLYSRDIIDSNNTGFPPDDYVFGTIEEIKEGDFGGVRPLEYVDLKGGRIIHGIGVTEWNDGECLFGPAKLYSTTAILQGLPRDGRHYRSMLVHFERGGEVLYNVWPEKETTTGLASPLGETGEGAIFDLQGRKMSSGKLPHGIYIENGQKRVR